MRINGDPKKISKGVEKQKLKFRLFYVWFIFSSLENSSFIYAIKNIFSLVACLKTAVGLKMQFSPRSAAPACDTDKLSFESKRFTFLNLQHFVAAF